MHLKKGGIEIINLFSAPYGAPQLGWLVFASWILGFISVFFILKMPTKLRRPLVVGLTFLSATYWIIYWLWPTPIPNQTDYMPESTVESVGIYLSQTIPVVNTIANVLAQLLLGLGIYSILRMHLGKVIRKQKDWGFSLVLLLSMMTIVIFGYWDWLTTDITKNQGDFSKWKIQNYARDMLFDGLLQQMDAAMFSLIAFFIFSAAYRAFRIRSVESTVMLFTAMLIMFSFMGLAEFLSNQWIVKVSGGNPDSFINNFRLVDLSEWVRSNIERPSIRALEFGLGIGGLSIALRIWLGLDRRGASL